MLLPRNYIPSRFIKLKWGLQDTNSQSVELPRVFKIFFLLFGLYQFNEVCVCVCVTCPYEVFPMHRTPGFVGTRLWHPANLCHWHSRWTAVLERSCTELWRGLSLWHRCPTDSSSLRQLACWGISSVPEILSWWLVRVKSFCLDQKASSGPRNTLFKIQIFF